MQNAKCKMQKVSSGWALLGAAAPSTHLLRVVTVKLFGILPFAFELRAMRMLA
jgi:hypothetical protein